MSLMGHQLAIPVLISALAPTTEVRATLLNRRANTDHIAKQMCRRRWRASLPGMRASSEAQSDRRNKGSAGREKRNRSRTAQSAIHRPASRAADCDSAGPDRHCPVQQFDGPPVAPDIRRFDGIWIGTLTCESTLSELPGWSYELVGNVRNGIFHSQRGPEGKPGSET